MARSAQYHFVTSWQVRSNCESVYNLLDDPTDLPRWWPAVYLRVKKTKSGDSRGIGAEYDMLTRGWLPYQLRWGMRSSDKLPHERLELEAFGDLVGRGVWSIKQQGELVGIEFDWRVRAEKPLIRRLSFLLKPMFSANHRWAMERGQESICRELEKLL